MIEGFSFLANLTLLPSNGLDVILGMNWLTQHKRIISRSPKYVEITHPSGHLIRCEPNLERTVSMLCNLEAQSIEEIPVVCEYPDVFPKELPGMSPNRDVEFAIDLFPGIGPIAKRPFRMLVDELEELKK